MKAPATSYIQELYDPRLLNYMTDEELLQFESDMEALVGGERLEDMISRVWPHEPPPRHVMPIIEVMEQARVTPIRLCISVGPGHAKTTTLLRSLVWWLSKSPADACAYITYSGGQAHDKSRVAREFAEEAGIQLANDATGHWITEYGGGLLAAGAKGKLTGQRIPGLLIVDDPYKDEFEARSATINNSVKERFKAIAFTRLQGGSIIVLHTRWAEDDLIGWLTRDLKWDCINIATVCDTLPDVLGRKMDEPAWPERYPLAICDRPCGHDGHLAEIRATIGEHLWASMYQGRPRPLGTTIFHEPSRFQLAGFSRDKMRGAIIIDPAATAKTTADWSVIMVCVMLGLGIESRMWIIHVERMQCEIPDLVKRARVVQKTFGMMIGCEAIGGFKAVPQSLRAIDPKLRVIDITTGSKDKFTRAIPLSAAWNQERVLVPEDAYWADALIDEFKRFTGNGDRHDDQVDAAAHGWNLLYREKPRITQEDYAEGGMA